MIVNMLCTLLFVVTATHGAAVVKRQILPNPQAMMGAFPFAPAGPALPAATLPRAAPPPTAMMTGEDPMEPSELGDGGNTTPNPMAALFNRMFGAYLGQRTLPLPYMNRFRMMNPFAVTPNSEDPMEPSELGDGGNTRPPPGMATTRPAIPMAPTQAPDIGLILQALARLQGQQNQQGAMPQQPPPVMQQPIVAPPAAPPAAAAPPPVVPPAAPIANTPQASPGQSSVFVVPGAQYGI